jgi:hypothetical protein
MPIPGDEGWTDRGKHAPFAVDAAICVLRIMNVRGKLTQRVNALETT